MLQTKRNGQWTRVLAQRLVWIVASVQSIWLGLRVGQRLWILQYMRHAPRHQLSSQSELLWWDLLACMAPEAEHLSQATGRKVFP